MMRARPDLLEGSGLCVVRVISYEGIPDSGCPSSIQPIQTEEQQIETDAAIAISQQKKYSHDSVPPVSWKDYDTHDDYRNELVRRHLDVIRDDGPAGEVMSITQRRWPRPPSISANRRLASTLQSCHDYIRSNQDSQSNDNWV